MEVREQLTADVKLPIDQAIHQNYMNIGAAIRGIYSITFSTRIFEAENSFNFCIQHLKQNLIEHYQYSQIVKCRELKYKENDLQNVQVMDLGDIYL